MTDAQVPLSAVEDIVWPAVPQDFAAQRLALLYQLEQSQFWPRELLDRWQAAQRERVARHAFHTVPFYRRRWSESGFSVDEPIDDGVWRRLPLLQRRDIQMAGEELHSTKISPSHGAVSKTSTSGSTNQPVTTLRTAVTDLFWKAITLRDHHWHDRDYQKSFAAIRYFGEGGANPPDGNRESNWGIATDGVYSTGPAHLLSINSSIQQQLDWLLRVDPAYLLAYPSVLLGIAKLLRERHVRLPSLTQVRCFGEILEPNCRRVCEEAFDTKVVDMYSSQEVGYIALQCSQLPHYHVQSESLLVEILDEEGRPCGPGQIGRVVITTLHNFAMPLVRYDIGDYAEVGADCTCGRQLPVLSRILGRQRNLLRIPTGESRWPIFDQGKSLQDLPLFFQFQVIQRELDLIEVRVVRPAPLTAREEEVIKDHMQKTLAFPFRVDIRVVDSIPRSPTGKFEDFVSELKAH